MTRGVRLYLVGSFVLVSLAGCGRGLFSSAEREPWRAEAEAACLKSGAVRETADLVRVDPISGPGVCGAEFPLKVAALGESNASLGFGDELRPPGSVGSGTGQPRWPIQPPPYGGVAQSPYRSPSGSNQNGPISLNAPGIPPDPEDEIELPPDGSPEAMPARAPQPRAPYGRYSSGVVQTPSVQSRSVQDYTQPRLGPGAGNITGAVGPVAVKPVATLACPIVSVLDRWLADSVQPAAMRWFGARVVEIRQISAYSCRGMNGNSRAHISEHAFGNALDIAAFTLADGRRVSVKEGWKGMPEEQGFLRDVQGAACQQFNTVLAPGSNVYHYDHIHVDLMRRSSRRVICQPAAVSGEEIASRAQQRGPYGNRDTSVTGALGIKKSSPQRAKSVEEDYEDE